MEFEVKVNDGKPVLITYDNEDEFSRCHNCTIADLDSLFIGAGNALDKKPVVNSGMFALLAGRHKTKPYRLIIYTSLYSDGYRLSKIDLSKLMAAMRTAGVVHG